MDVHVLSSRVLLPGDPNSAPSKAPLTVFDRFASNIYIAVLFAFSPPTPPNDALIAGLSKTLLLFPTLAGQLDYSRRLRRPCLIVGGCGGGALVVEAAASSNLSDHLPLEVSPDFQLLHPSPASAVHVFQVQLNRFACGGLIIGATAHHRVADGQSMSIFFTTWAQTVRGAFVDRPPVYDQSWLKPRCPPHCEFNHWGLEFAPLNSSSLYGDEELVPVYDVDGNVLSPMLEVDSWLRFRFEDVDFGGGGALRAFLPTWVPFEGLVMVLPGFGEDGG
uniref:Uncharacterized protein n=1 Tax=Ananas comosus var. bracteatus TaxID=296719 RepID=A0A6V7PFB9_ANACO|nr:unnamed protein product [Ananas comosus var. bracteatus]